MYNNLLNFIETKETQRTHFSFLDKNEFLSALKMLEDKNAYLPGDINGDGTVGTKDVTVLRRYIAGGYHVTVVDEALDVNADGEVTTKDVTVLRRFIAGGYGVELK